jgi:tRNA threonylcarbamoyladenosine biosynthesis protein TsaE
MTHSALKLRLPDAAAADELGRALARTFPGAAARALVIYLRGELGVGKTTVVRGLLRGLGVRTTVRSPSYTLVEPYSVGGLECVHVDLYRLRSASEVEDLGLRDALGAGHLLLIEWPERVASGLPAADLEVQLAYAAVGRVVTLEAAGDSGSAWVDHLGSDGSIVSYLSNLT